MESTFRDDADLQNLEIVATAQPEFNNDPDTPPIFTDDAALNIFDSQCRLLYEVQFPEALEISFETLHWGSSKLLYFAAVVEGADDVHYEHYFLDQGLTPVGPALVSDERLNSVFVGALGPGRGFGVAETLLPNSDWMGEQRDPHTVLQFIPGVISPFQTAEHWMALKARSFWITARASGQLGKSVPVGWNGSRFYTISSVLNAADNVMRRG